MLWLRAILPFLLAARAPVGEAELILEGATAYVAADAPPATLSILVRDGKIVFVADPPEVRRLAPDAKAVDLSGRFVFPGWTDAHGHLEGLGRALEIADLRGAADAAQAASRMAARAAALPKGAWAEGRGWDQNHWPGSAFPDAKDLDRALPDRPALAVRVDGHAIWVNSAALKAAGVTAATPDPEGGRILRRPDGSPSGVFVDNARALVERIHSAGSEADRERRLLAAMRACAKVGLTEVHDASGYGPEGIAILERLASRRELPIRVYATVSPDPKLLAELFRRGPRVGGGADWLTVRAIKGYADGALGSRGAALLADYADEPGNRGLMVTPPERLEALALEARRNGWQLWVHAIGDRGNRVSLDAFRKAVLAAPDAAAGGSRPRIEHAQVVAVEDIPRFGFEGVIASIQPTHATSDMPWAEKRVGPSRIAGAYAWKSLLRSGARLSGGSDFPVESEDPRLGFYAAVTRQDLSGRPPGGWRLEDRLSRAEALALFTSGAAWASFEEQRRGRIAPGFEADLTVFAADPMAVAEGQIPSVPVVLTMVGGRVSYTAGAAARPAP
ncbi:MAG: amidohydrolase [Thermoanaerobaculia bacterium]